MEDLMNKLISKFTLVALTATLVAPAQAKLDKTLVGIAATGLTAGFVGAAYLTYTNPEFTLKKVKTLVEKDECSEARDLVMTLDKKGGLYSKRSHIWNAIKAYEDRAYTGKSAGELIAILDYEIAEYIEYHSQKQSWMRWATYAATFIGGFAGGMLITESR